MKKRLILTSIVAFLFGFSAVSLAAPPLDCVTPTTDNSQNDPSCNASGTSTNCLEYCPGYSSGFISPVAGQGLVVLYEGGSSVTVDNTAIDETTVCNQTTCSGMVEDPNATVAEGDQIVLTATAGSEVGIGWRSPNSDGTCGEAIPRTDGNGNYGTSSITTLESQVPEGYTIISEQCWGDVAIGDSDFDFNEMKYIVAVGNGTPITSTPTQLPRTGILDSDDPFNLVIISVLFIAIGVGVNKAFRIIKEEKISKEY